MLPTQEGGRESGVVLSTRLVEWRAFIDHARVTGADFSASATSNIIESMPDRDVTVSSDSSSETVSGR